MHGFANLFELTGDRLLSVRKDRDRSDIGMRTAFPYVIGHRNVARQNHSAFGKSDFKAAEVVFGNGKRIAADLCIFRKVLTEPLTSVGDAFCAKTHEFDAGAFKLSCGLLPIATVGPKKGAIGRYDHAAVGSRKARKITQKHPVFGQVFAQMGISGCNEPGV